MWKTVKLGDVCDFQGGSQPPKKDFIYEERAEYVRFIQIRDFKSDKNLTYIPITKKNKICKKNEVLIGRYGASVGKILVGLEGAYNVALMKTIPNEEQITKGWLQAYLKSPLFQNPLMEVSKRSAQNGFSKEDIDDFKIPLPPLAEQQRIVAKLDAAFAEIDKAVEAADMSGKKLQEQQTLNTENVFNETCSPFKKIVLGDVCDGVQYGTSSKCSKIGKYPVLRMGNIQNGAFDVSDLVYLDDEIEAKKYELNKGDVLFNRTNSSVHVGKTGVFDEVDDYLFAGYLIRVNYLKDKVLPQFLSYYLNSRKIREYGFSVMSESINQSNINGTKLKKYPFYEVPLEAQKNAAQKISAVNRASDEAINLYRKKVKALIKLKSALLATELQSEAG